MHGSDAELGGKVGGQGEAGVADDLTRAAPPAYCRRRPTMPLTDMEAMWRLWCLVLIFEKCPVRQIENATTL